MYNKLFCFVAATALLASCSADDFADRNEQTDGPGINFGVTASATDGFSRGGAACSSQSIILKSDNSSDSLAVYVESAPGFLDAKSVSRGAPVTDAGFKAFQVYAFLYRDEAVVAPSLFFEEPVKKENGSWTTETIYYWPTAAESKLAFFGVSPQDAMSDGRYGVRFDQYQIPGNQNDAVITYLTPAAAADQPDLMVASTDKMNGKDTPGFKVPMQFKHILSQVRFEVGAEMQNGVINSITLTNIAKQGYYRHNNPDQPWILDQDGTDDTMDITIDVEKDMSETSAPGTGINTLEQTLMLLPQQLTADNKLIVNFTKADGTVRTMEAPLSGQWAMGGSTVYRINIKPDYTLEFAETEIPALDAHYEKFQITVNSDKLQNGWTLTSNYPNDVFFTTVQTQLQKDGFWIDNKKGNSSLDGMGTQTVYVYVTENVGTGENRDIKLTLTPKGIDNPASVEKSVMQYAPALTADGAIGVEQIFDMNRYPWGFKFDDVKVTYTYPSATDRLSRLLLEGYKWLLFDSNWLAPILGIEKLPSFVKKGSGTTICTFHLSDIQFNEAQSATDGRANTWLLYSYDGFSAINALDSYFSGNANIKKTITPPDASLDNVTNYAAYMVMKNCNKFSEKFETHNNVTITVAVLAEADCVWYLPASGQYDQVGGAVNLTDTYWTSTSDTGYDNAYSYTSGVLNLESRLEERKIVAVRSLR